ncbi:MAG: hypothetical protein AAF745_04885 [Planctomycetota bacterium]
MSSPASLTTGKTRLIAELAMRRCWQLIAAAMFAMLLWSVSGCSNLRLPAIDPTGSCLLSPLPTTTSLSLPCCNGDCQCLGCLTNLGACLRCPGFQFPEPAFTEPVEPPECLDPTTAIGNGLADTGPCVPGPNCGGDCLHGPPAVLYGDEINATKTCELPTRGKRGCILLSPQKIVAPVGGEVMLLSGICGTDGMLQMGEPLEWMLSQDSVGNFIDVGDDDPGVLHKLAGIETSRKSDPGFAQGVTSTKASLITRGNTNPSDDVKLEKGQTWLTISSASEGTSHVTVLAPESECWDQRKASATIYWVDARWQFPGPQSVPAGASVDLTTRVTRAEGSLPARGWKVRYEILQPELATFAGTDGSPVVEVNVDDSGNATATLVPVPGTSGNAVIDVQVIRPGGTVDNMPDLTLGRGQSYVTWSSPQLTLRAGGPEVASSDTEFTVFAVVGNPGNQPATGVAVEVNVPQNTRVIRSDAFAKVYTESVVWDIGTIPPQQELELSLSLASANPVALGFQARGDGGLLAEDVVRVDIFRPSLTLRVTPDQDRVQTGDRVRFSIEVENTGDRPLSDVSLAARGDTELIHVDSDDREVFNDKTDGPLQPGEIWTSPVTFVPTGPGRRCLNVTATASRGQRAEAGACVTVINPPPVTPAVSASFSIALPNNRTQTVVGENVLARGVVENTGRVPLTNLRATMAYDPQLSPLQATMDYPRDTDTPYIVAWTIDQLPPGDSITLETVFQANAPTQRSPIVFAVQSAEGARDSQSRSIQVLPGNAPASPLTAPAPNLPPATPPPSIPGGPGTQPSPPQSFEPPRIAPPRRGSLRLDVLQRDIAPRVGDPIRYSLIVTNDTDQLDGAVQLAFDLPPGVAVRNLTSRDSAALSQFQRSGNTIYFEEIRSMKAGESINYELVLTSNQPKTFNLNLQATSRNIPGGVQVTQVTEVAP